MAGLCAPLSTLRQYPRGYLRMTRGRCGWLLLNQNGLAPSTPCRSPGALRSTLLNGHSQSLSACLKGANNGSALLFDHLVGAGEHGWGHSKTQCLGGLQIDHQLVPCRRLHGEVRCLLALQDAVDITSRAAVLVGEIGAIRDQAARRNEHLLEIDRRHPVSRGE